MAAHINPVSDGCRRRHRSEGENQLVGQFAVSTVDQVQDAPGKESYVRFGETGSVVEMSDAFRIGEFERPDGFSACRIDCVHPAVFRFGEEDVFFEVETMQQGVGKQEVPRCSQWDRGQFLLQLLTTIWDGAPGQNGLYGLIAPDQEQAEGR